MAMMAAADMLDLDDHASITPSIEEEYERHSPTFDLPSQHSGFRSENPESEIDDHSSIGAPWSPPGFKSHNMSASGWFRQDPYGRYQLRPSHSPSHSRQTSPEYQDAPEDADITIAARVPLPRGTESPTKERSPEPEQARFDTPEADATRNNYIRFAVRAEVQHREPFVAFFNLIQRKIDAITRTKSSTLLSILIAFLSLSAFRVIFAPSTPPPVPDLVKLSTLAKSFEPLIFYSENGYAQITALQETSVAVWDLGESVRTNNMTSAPVIVQNLDDLSDNLKTLGLELTRFFADVDADVDSILIVMDWAKRELAALSSSQHGPPISGVVFDRVHSLLNRGGLLESSVSGSPTALGNMLNSIFGASSPQRTRAVLTRTFYEFLNVLEESINSELTHSTVLFTLFEAIDRQFLNLQRTVVRETDTQEKLESELLSSLWTRVIGGNSAMIRKFERNKELLRNLRSRTVSNKHLIMEHHGRLQTLKVNLETLRRKLVSPLIKRNDSVSFVENGEGGIGIVEAQIKGLEGTYDYLKGVREKQKGKLMEMVYGAGGRKSKLIGGMERVEIEGR